MRQGVAAFNREDYVVAAQMYETGRGVPQNYTEAAMWYRRAASPAR
mgnify:CR=1 FL=1